MLSSHHLSLLFCLSHFFSNRSSLTLHTINGRINSWILIKVISFGGLMLYLEYFCWELIKNQMLVHCVLPFFVLTCPTFIHCLGTVLIPCCSYFLTFSVSQTCLNKIEKSELILQRSLAYERNPRNDNLVTVLSVWCLFLSVSWDLYIV